MLRIYAVELATELETGSWLPTGEYTPPDTTQLIMFSFQFFYQICRQSSCTSCEFDTYMEWCEQQNSLDS